jgi:hypothetical protein
LANNLELRQKTSRVFSKGSFSSGLKKLNLSEMTMHMKGVTALRKEVKRYIDTADVKVLKMIHAMLEVEQESDWWDELSEDAKSSINRGLKQAQAGELTAHEVVMKKHRKWLSK